MKEIIANIFLGREIVQEILSTIIEEIRYWL